jgi:hypothetical protein
MQHGNARSVAASMNVGTCRVIASGDLFPFPFRDGRIQIDPQGMEAADESAIA